jgi:hypothetical protein
LTLSPCRAANSDKARLSSAGRRMESVSLMSCMSHNHPPLSTRSFRGHGMRVSYKKLNTNKL